MSRKGQIIYRNAALDLRKRCGDMVRACVRKMNEGGGVARWKTPDETDYTAAIELLAIRMNDELCAVFKQYRMKASTYEPLFSMPPARRPKAAKTGKPLTLVERRAASAKRKVREWQRKSKLAATKIKAYRKKVSYYTKKGVIQ